METPERVRPTIDVHDFAETGTDRSAGGATRAAAVIITALLVPYALLRLGLRSVITGLQRAAAVIVTAVAVVCARLLSGLRSLENALRRPASILAGATWRVTRGLASVTRMIGAALTVVARNTTAALTAVVRPFGAALTATRRWVGTARRALIALVRWVGAGAARSWRDLAPIARFAATGIQIVTGLLLALARGVVRLLRGCASAIGILFHGAWLTVRWPVLRLSLVGLGLTRVLIKLLRTARVALRLILAPFHAGGRAAFLVIRSVVRRAGAVVRLLRRTASTTGRRVARVVAAGGRGLGVVCAAVGRRVARVVAAGGRRLGWGFATAARLASRLAAAAWRPTGRLLRSVLRPVQRVVVTMGGTAARVLTVVGHQIKRAISFGLVRLARVGAAGSGKLARLLGAWRYRMASIAEAIAGLSRRAANGARLAAGTASHRANRLALSASSTDWRLTAYADRSPVVLPEDGYRASFTLDVHENEYLPPAESSVSAVISISSEIDRESADRPEMVEVILLDCSASMAHPWDKILNARRATQAAVASLPDGVWFAVVRGAESGELAYPRRSGLVRASDRTRSEAFKAIAALWPVGGTAIGRWLSLASELVALRPGALGHALLLTDGKDEDETPTELQGALEECEGAFQCDCRGVGTDWAVEELRRVSTALLGTVDIIREPAEMEADFRAVIERAMSRGIEASIRIRMPVHAKVTAFRQVSPTVVDLTSRGRPIDAQTLEFRLGGWADERREYQLNVEVKPGPVGSEMAACRLALVAANKTYSSGLVRAIWTHDLELAADFDPEVAHYTGQAELAAAVQEGLQARREGDLDTATLRLRRAVQLAASSGNADLLGLLARVVDIVDGDTAGVNLRNDVDAYDEMALDTRSTRTVPTRAVRTTTSDAEELGPTPHPAGSTRLAQR